MLNQEPKIRCVAIQSSINATQGTIILFDYTKILTKYANSTSYVSHKSIYDSNLLNSIAIQSNITMPLS